MNSPNARAPVIVWWVLWAVTLVGLPFIYMFLKTPQTEPLSPALRYLPLALFAASVFLRWAVLPNVRALSTALPVFVIGLTLAEVCMLAGMFLVPDWRMIYFALALTGAVQYAPVFASNYYT